MNKYTMFDYIAWRKDINFNALEFNEIDNLVLTNLSYIRFRDIVPNNKSSITIHDAIEAFLKKDITMLDIRDKKDVEFLILIKDTKRYGNLKMLYHQEIYEDESETQFGAWLIEIKRNLYFLSYRGTDNFIAGWKEDLNLTFETVKAQKLALAYLEEVTKKFTFAKFICAGHSKGGNLVMYACAHASKQAYKKVIKIYNNDGPGFDFKHIDIEPYLAINNKLVSFTPEFSFVGQMMTQPKDMTIIQSNAVLVLQHDMYTWLMEPDKLIRSENIDVNALKCKRVLTKWLDALNLDERRKFVNGIYEIIQMADAKDIFGILPGLVKNRKAIQNKLTSMDVVTRNAIESSFNEFFESLRASISISLETLGTSIHNKIFNNDKK